MQFESYRKNMQDFFKSTNDVAILSCYARYICHTFTYMQYLNLIYCQLFSSAHPPHQDNTAVAPFSNCTTSQPLRRSTCRARSTLRSYCRIIQVVDIVLHNNIK